MLSEDQIQLLIQKAAQAQKYAFVPNSDHKFGACVLSLDGNYYEGCTIESVISGLGSCAERVAMNNAVTNGRYILVALAVVSDEITYPCGACLQYLAQFYQVAQQEIVIITSDLQGKYKVNSLFELLPQPYLSLRQKEKIQRYSSKK